LTLIYPTPTHHWLFSELPLLDLDAQAPWKRVANPRRAQALGALAQESGRERRLVAQKSSQQTACAQQLGSQRHHAYHTKRARTDLTRRRRRRRRPQQPTHVRTRQVPPKFVPIGEADLELSRPQQRDSERTPAQPNNEGGVRKGQESNDESGMETHLTPTEKYLCTSEANRRG
jgi:hypothetical protein